MSNDEGFVPDPMRFDFARRDVREFLGLLAQEAYSRAQIVHALNGARIRPGDVALEQSARWAWADALKVAGTAGRLRLLLSTMLEDDQYTFAHEHIQRLLAGESVPVAASSPGVGALKTSGWRGGREAQTAPRSGLVDIGFLMGGLRAAKSVFRIGVQKEGGSVHGTAFLIAPSRVLTNHHVLFDEEGRPGSDVTLHVGHEIGLDGRERILKTVSGVDASICGDKALDWAVIDVEERFEEDAVLSLGGSPPAPADYVSIIQHPFGRTKKIALFHNEVRFVDDTYVQYLTDTEPGSSGAPVFNTRWEVVALHHSWVPAVEEKLQVRNEGILIGRVAAALRVQGLLAA